MDSKPDKSRPTITTRIGISVPAALGALLVAGAIVFGSSMVNDFTRPTDQTGQDQTGQDKPDQTDSPKGDDAVTDGVAYTDKDETPPHQANTFETDQPKPEEPKDEPKPDPKPTEDKPAPKPPAAGQGSLSLEAAAFSPKVKLSWSKFTGDGFAYYKIVRSSDANASWPLGAGDQLIAYASGQADTYFKDFPPCGKEWHYRVFAVASSGAGYAVLAASNTVGAGVDCITEPSHPPVSDMLFDVTVVEGTVHLSWEPCSADGFAAYKVVRSQTNPDPKYPLNDGTQLIAVFGDSSVTTMIDSDVAPGQTWSYRVLSMGSDSTGWYPLGMTAAVTVTVE